MFLSRCNLLRVFSIKLFILSRFSLYRMDESKRSLIAESAVRQLKLYGYEGKGSGDENYERFRQVTYSENGLRLQEIIQEQLGSIQPAVEPKSTKLVHISQHQQKELQTVLPVIWEHVQEITDSENAAMETVLLIYGSSTLCVEICRPVNPDVDAPSPDPYGEQLFELEREAVKILKYVTGRQVATTAIELMTLFGVKDSNTEQENLSHFASVSNSQHGEDLRLLVGKYLDSSSASDTKLLMKGILTLMWANINDIEDDDDSGAMQFLLMMYGSSVLITELEKRYPQQDLNNLSKIASEYLKEEKLLPLSFQDRHSGLSISKIYSSVTSVISGVFKSKTNKKDE